MRRRGYGPLWQLVLGVALIAASVALLTYHYAPRRGPAEPCSGHDGVEFLLTGVGGWRVQCEDGAIVPVTIREGTRVVLDR